MVWSDVSRGNEHSYGIHEGSLRISKRNHIQNDKSKMYACSSYTRCIPIILSWMDVRWINNWIVCACCRWDPPDCSDFYGKSFILSSEAPTLEEYQWFWFEWEWVRRSNWTGFACCRWEPSDWSNTNSAAQTLECACECTSEQGWDITGVWYSKGIPMHVYVDRLLVA